MGINIDHTIPGDFFYYPKPPPPLYIKIRITKKIYHFIERGINKI